jgi:hypothetical protein
MLSPPRIQQSGSELEKIEVLLVCHGFFLPLMGVLYLKA